jgi:hypothetical protein
MNLFLDDERVPMQAYYLTNNKAYMAYTWDIVRNYDQFTTHIETHGLPSLVSFDHDLADEHYKIGAKEEFLGFDYNKTTEKTGLSCAKWLCDYCQVRNLKFPNYLIHSANPAGAANIKSYIENYKKHVEKF